MPVYRLTGVMQKFDQIAESGQVHDDGMPCEQWMDVGAQRAAKRPPIPSGIVDQHFFSLNYMRVRG
jgi:hypothetical protein